MENSKRFILILVFMLMGVGSVFAQNNAQGMKLLTINSLMIYGQMLYDRGDLKGASDVFNHVLTFDHHQLKAISFLRSMGENPIVPIDPPQPVASSPMVEIIKRVVPVAKPVVQMDTDSLEKAIEDKKAAIEHLHQEIDKLKAQQNT